MFELLSQLIFRKKQLRVIVVMGRGSLLTLKAISLVLGDSFKIGEVFNRLPCFKEISKNQILLFASEENGQAKKFKFFLKNSSQPILVIASSREAPPEDIIFAPEKSKFQEELLRALPAFGYLVFNFDDETVRDESNKSNARQISFGFDKGSQFQITDYKISADGTNFKINFGGNILPIWLSNLFGKKNVYSVSAALGVGYAFGLNLVKLSQSLTGYQGAEGEGKLIDGIKGSFLLDDSANANVFSMHEMLNILRDLGSLPKFTPAPPRKIAVLGDVLGIGRYTIEAHQAIGERVARTADLLFTVGPRAKFIAQAAREKGMASEKIFEFDEIPSTISKLKTTVREGDLILIDGSQEMQMPQIVEALKKL